MPSNLAMLTRIWDLQAEVKQWDLECPAIFPAVAKIQGALLDAELRLQDEIHGHKRVQ